MFQFERNLKNKRFVALIDGEMVMMVVVVVMMILSLSVLEKKNLSVSLAINASEGVLRFYVRHPKTFVWGRRGKKLRKRKKTTTAKVSSLQYAVVLRHMLVRFYRQLDLKERSHPFSKI